RERLRVRLGRTAALEPVRVAPLVLRAEDHRRGSRRMLRRERVRVGLLQHLPGARPELVLVSLAGLRALDEPLPDAGVAERAQRMRGCVPAVEVADDADRLGVRRPDRERDPALDDVCAELRVQLLVPAGARQVEIELTETRHQNALSRSRTIPATG